MKRALWLSCLYVLFSFSMKMWATRVMAGQMEEEIAEGKMVSVAPATFGAILWRGLIETESGYFICYWSPFDDELGRYDYIEKNRELASDLEGDEVFEALKWFSRGHWVARQGENGRTVVVDVRFTEIRDEKSGRFHPIFQWHVKPRSEWVEGKIKAPMMRPKELDYRGANSRFLEKDVGRSGRMEQF